MSSQSRLHIKGGKVVNDDTQTLADVFVENGIIKEVGQNLVVPGGCRVIDANGLLVIPGGIDPHVHMQMPFMGTYSNDDFYTGTRAALAGGTTMIIDFVKPDRNDSLLTWYDQYRSWADPKVCCDYGLHVIVPHVSPKGMEEMKVLVNDKGVNSFKVFLAYKDVLMLSDREFLEMAQKCRELGAVLQVHAENGDVLDALAKQMVEKHHVTGPEGHLLARPAILEAEATGRAIAIADAVNCPLYVVHVMSVGAADAIAKARREGALVYGEPIAVGVGVDGAEVKHQCWRHAAGFVLSPPVRPSNDPKVGNTNEHLLRLLACGELELVGSDHCVFMGAQKALGKDDFRKIPNGVNGVEDRMSVVWEKGVATGIMDPCRFVAVTSSNAARIFNCYPRKGRIAPGSDADIVLWDPQATRTISKDTHHQNVDFNIFEGMVCHGVPKYVICNGALVVEEGQLHVVQGAGRFVSTPANSPYVFSRVRVRENVKKIAPVSREPYTGPVHDPSTDAAKKKDEASTEAKPLATDKDAPPTPSSPNGSSFSHSRPPTRGGTRNMQDSTFCLSGEQADDSQPVKTSIRTHQPPGGASSRPW